jgi:proteic killer suppression protein
MVLSFGDRDTEDVANDRLVKRFAGISSQAQRRMQILNQAQSVNDLQNLRGNRLERLRGDLNGYFSIRINDQWRLVFRWDDGAAGPERVRIMDYH